LDELFRDGYQSEFANPNACSTNSALRAVTALPSHRAQEAITAIVPPNLSLFEVRTSWAGAGLSPLKTHTCFTSNVEIPVDDPRRPNYAFDG
jgi:hypothetical protein